MMMAMTMEDDDKMKMKMMMMMMMDDLLEHSRTGTYGKYPYRDYPPKTE